MKCREWKTGYSSKFYFNKFSLEDMHGKKTMELMKAAGLSCMELSCTYEEMEEIGFISDPEKIKIQAEETGIELWSVHLPYNALENGRHVERFVRSIKVIDAAAKAGFKVITIHPSYEGIQSHRREEKLKDAIVNIKIIAEYCRSRGLIPAVEDLPRSCLGHNTDEMLKILEGCPEAMVTFDTNHILVENNDDNLSFIRAIGPRIVSTHISDYDLEHEKHWIPFDGKNDWKNIVKLLEEAGYTGPFLYEIRWNSSEKEENLPITPERLRKIHMDIAAMTE
jgi:sugar phosphate isomerase/epimerase